ncbi:MAG: CHASE2 domain-containing protein, partial [Leptolyngbyaceae bacterium]|nr:CHASE2 domain-containing protein [Leptolyngbyaceae bacterium]
MISQFHRSITGVWQSAGHWLPGAIAATATFISVELGAFQAFQSFSYNLLFRLRGPANWDERIVVVEIDDVSLQNLGQFPLERQYYAQFLRRVSSGDPSVVGIDIVFSEASEGDAALASEMAQLNRVVLALGWSKKGVPIWPVPELSEQAVSLGHVLYQPSGDGMTRSVAPYIQDVPSLGVAIAQAYDLIYEPVNIPDNQHGDSQTVWINWPGPSQTAQSYSFYDVVIGRVNPDVFQNKIVLLGVTASGSSPLVTPFNRIPPTGGVYLQAAVLSNILKNNLLRRPGSLWTLTILILGGPVMGLLTHHRSSQHRWFSVFCLGLGWMLLGIIGLRMNVLMPLGWPVVLITLTTGLTEITERWRANRILQQEVHRLWNTYHADLIEWSSSSVADSYADADLDEKNFDEKSRDQVSMHSSLTPAQRFEQALSARPVATQRAYQLAMLAELFGRSQSLHAAIAQNVSIGIAAADWTGRVWMCNPVAQNLLTLNIGDTLEQCLTPKWVTSDQWAHRIQAIHQSPSSQWEAMQNERWYEIKIEPLAYPPSSNPVRADADENSSNSLMQPIMPHSSGWLLMIRDITAFKQVEAEILKALQEALEFSQLKTRFVSMASHELRTPLTVIRTCAELLQAHGEKIPPEKRQDYLERMKTTISEMKKLIDDVLVLGRVESQGLHFEPTPVDVVQFCRDVIHHFQPDDAPIKRIQLTLKTQAPHHNLDENL